MERLGTYTQPFEELGPQRTLYVCSVGTFEGLAEEVQPSSRYFGLFVAMDARGVDDRLIRKVADGLVAKGLASCCVWGPDCQRVHDRLDDAAFVANSLDEGTDDVIMTTWHDGDTLREALRYFVEGALATPKYEPACTDWIAVSVGNPEWASVIRKKLAGMVRRNQSSPE